MERRNFIRLVGILAATCMLFVITSCENQTSAPAIKKEIYEWRIYTLTGEDGTALDNYFKDIMIPAYSRQGIKAGAFRPLALREEEQDTRHILFIYPDINTYFRIKDAIWEDEVFTNAAQPFFDATAPRGSIAFSNYETYLSEAFSQFPAHRVAEGSQTVFQCRIYWSGNEEANKRKVKMFQEGEIAIFDESGINSVFYGEIFAGPRMPAIMYLTSYKDEESMTEVWGNFRANPGFRPLSQDPQYANTAINNRTMILSPMPYSQL